MLLKGFSMDYLCCIAIIVELFKVCQARGKSLCKLCRLKRLEHLHVSFLSNKLFSSMNKCYSSLNYHLWVLNLLIAHLLHNINNIINTLSKYFLLLFCVENMSILIKQSDWFIFAVYKKDHQCLFDSSHILVEDLVSIFWVNYIYFCFSFFRCSVNVVITSKTHY